MTTTTKNKKTINKNNFFLSYSFETRGAIASAVYTLGFYALGTRGRAVAGEIWSAEYGTLTVRVLVWPTTRVTLFMATVGAFDVVAAMAPCVP